jgi:hypothetical protein
MKVAALDQKDDRSVEVEVAGVAALLVAKCHKLHDRVASGRSDRLDDKDAADVIRLMQTSSPAEVGATLAALSNDPTAGPVTVEALGYIDELFGRRGRQGLVMATRALRGAIPEAQIETLSVAYCEALLRSARPV